tara:strand:- start:428 stop:1174 length:747 start_codon:yes stop_codon:yes gene_type:complete
MNKTNLSVNLNKVALLRNARGSNYPSLVNFAKSCMKHDICGLTLHPRSDERHALSSDVIDLATLCKENNFEFNIEGNPFNTEKGSFKGYENLVTYIKPYQATLVPDEDNQITSDHGWIKGGHDKELKLIIERLLENCTYVSMFIDANIESVDYALEMGVNAVEIYTGPYAQLNNDERVSCIEEMHEIFKYIKSNNLKLNAGHDLNLENLPDLINLNIIDEVSIGHAIITESIIHGLDSILSQYIKIIR